MVGQRLHNKTALITGSTQGIGRATALAMAREGADIVVNGRPTQNATQQNAAEETARAIQAIGRQAMVCYADVGDREQVEKMFDDAIRRFEHLDIVVANAAFEVKESIIHAEWDHVRRMVDVCFYGVFNTCQLAARQMVKQVENGHAGGRILINGSVHADVGVKFHGVYGMCKAAGKHLCRILAAELAPYRINVNSVNPGWIDTPNERTFITEEQLQEAAQELPWKRLGTVDEIAAAFVFLASRDADYISGHALVVDGGLSLDYGCLTAGLDERGDD